MKRQVRQVVLFTALATALASPAWAQSPTGPICTVQALNRIAQINPDGTFILSNVPADGRLIRIEAICSDPSGLRGGASPLTPILADAEITLEAIQILPIEPGVEALIVIPSSSVLRQAGDSVSLSVLARLANGTYRNVSREAEGTSFISSNPAVATADSEGHIHAQNKSGTVNVTILHRGIVASRKVHVILAGDADTDGLPDDFERLYPCLSPSTPDATADPDVDGRTNLQEFQTGTDPCVADTDGDGLSDGQEATIGSNPVLPDSDLDGLLDGQEPNPTGNGDGDGLINILDPDQDNDGLPDGIEVRICGNPTCASPTADSDGDGLSNLDEVQLGTNPTLADTDGDGLTDSAEVLRGTDPINPDMDGDGFPDGFEVTLGSDPKNPASVPTPPPVTEAVGRPFAVLNTGSPAPPASIEAVGRVFSILNTAPPAAPATLEATSRTFSLLNSAPPASPASLEAVGRTFSLLNQAGPPPPSSLEAVGRLFSVQNTTPP